MRRALFIALAFLAACSKGGAPGKAPAPAKASNAAAAAPAPPSAKLAKIFSADILGANLAYLETITGPAFKTEGEERTYKVDGCTVIVGAAKGRIDNIGLVGVSDRCSFPLAQYFASGYDHPVPRVPTFGDIRTGLGGDYDADCLALCGNAADPVVSLSYEGSHADNFNGLLAEVQVVDDPVLKAWGDWGDKLVARYGQAAVMNGRYRSGDTLQEVAAKDFAALRPTTIRVGQNLPAASE